MNAKRKAVLMTLSQMLVELAERTPKPEPVYWVEPRPRCFECRDFEVMKDGQICEHCKLERKQGYQVMTLAGRCANGFEMDHGRLNHAVSEVGALCGAKPGRRSVGWSREFGDVTCPRCVAKLRKYNKVIPA